MKKRIKYMIEMVDAPGDAWRRLFRHPLLVSQLTRLYFLEPRGEEGQ